MALSLDDHARVPPVGLGTWKNSDPEQCARSVETAIEIGYRHIDTAQLYENESAVGDGIQAASVDRDELFIASKVTFKKMTYDDVLSSTEESLRKLGLDTLDLMYVHWPAGQYSAEETLPAFDRLVEEGMIRHIGVSNFTEPLLDEAREALDHPIYAHQFEMHPLFPQDDLRAYNDRHDIHTVAYSPFRHGTIFDEPTIQQVADAHDSTSARVALAWLVEKGAYPIPKATGESHLRDNFKALDLSLSDDDVRQIDGIDRVDRYIDPPFAPW